MNPSHPPSSVPGAENKTSLTDELSIRLYGGKYGMHEIAHAFEERCGFYERDLALLKSREKALCQKVDELERLRRWLLENVDWHRTMTNGIAASFALPGPNGLAWGLEDAFRVIELTPPAPDERAAP